MERSGLNFSASIAKAQRKNKLTVLDFKVTDDYVKRFESSHGRPSVFAGSDRVEVELIYGRVASVVTYRSYSGEEFGLTLKNRHTNGLSPITIQSSSYRVLTRKARRMPRNGCGYH